MVGRGILLHPDDEIVVVLASAAFDDTIIVSDAESVTVCGEIPAGHKVARRALPAGTLVHKYGQIIGRLTASVRCGEHVHIQNLESLRAVGGHE